MAIKSMDIKESVLWDDEFQGWIDKWDKMQQDEALNQPGAGVGQPAGVQPIVQSVAQTPQVQPTTATPQVNSAALKSQADQAKAARMKELQTQIQALQTQLQQVSSNPAGQVVQGR